MLKITCIRYIVAIFTGLLMGMVLSCTRTDEDQKPRAKSEPAMERPAADPVRIQPEATKARPVETPGQLVISPSAETGSQLYTSWPLIISATLWRKAMLPDDQGNLPADEPITLKAKTGSWQEALVLEVKTASGDPVAWPFQLVKKPEDSISLGVDDSASAEWWLDPSQTRTLPEGVYTISVSFNSNLVDGLPGDIAGDWFQLKIAAEPSPLDKKMESEKQLQMALFSWFKNDADTAGKIVDELLLRDPENIGGLRLKSKLLEQQRKKRQALLSLDTALDSYYKQYPDACPPAGIFQERAELLKDMVLPTVKEDGKQLP